MKDFPSNSILKINHCIGNYKEVYKKIPDRTIVNNDVYLKLSGEFMLMPKKKKKKNGSYTGYLLNNNKGGIIEVHSLDKLPKEKQSELEELTKEMNLPIIFCCHGTIKKFKDIIPYDLSSLPEELAKNVAEEQKEEQKNVSESQ